MKHKSIIILLLVIIFVILLCPSIYATNNNITLVKDKEIYNSKDTIIISFNISDINLEGGIETLISKITYNKNLYESCTINAESGWETSFNSNSGKIILQRLDGIKENSTIFKVNLKVKDNITQMTDDNISISEINISDIDTDLFLDSITTKISIKGIEIEEEEEKYLKDNSYLNIKDIGQDIKAITGITEETSVEKLINDNFNNKFTIKVYNNDNIEIEGATIVGSGYKVQLLKNGNIAQEYIIIIYGDTDGNGRITVVDALAIIKHINEKIKFKNIAFLEASRVRPESAEELSAVDALAVIKKINGKYTINKFR